MWIQVKKIPLYSNKLEIQKNKQLTVSTNLFRLNAIQEEKYFWNKLLRVLPVLSNVTWCYWSYHSIQQLYIMYTEKWGKHVHLFLSPVQDIFGDTPRNSLFLGVVHLYDCGNSQKCANPSNARGWWCQWLGAMGKHSIVRRDVSAMMQVHVVKVPGFIKRSLSKWKIKR